MSGSYISAAKEEKALCASGRGSLLGAAVMPAATMAADRYVYFFDAPDTATVTNVWAAANPTKLVAGPYLVQKSTPGISIEVGPDEMFGFTSGLVAASSTSDTAYTASGSADFRLNVSAAERI